MEMFASFKQALLGVYTCTVDQALHKTSLRVALISALGLCASVYHPSQSSSSLVDKYIRGEGPAAKEGLLANIGPSGSKSAGAKAGIVIASPNTVNPDYLYSWIRDASLVFKLLIDQYTTGEDGSLRGLIDDYVGSQTILQQVSNPSGTVVTGGLGEPKFEIDETAFTGPWGRPQRDGPALRSTALITYANWLIENGNTTYVSTSLWPVLQLDLDYVHDNWNQTTFDLWEEISSSSFFTTAAQHRALRQGAAIAQTLGYTNVAANYTVQADNVLCFLQSYWNPTQGYITSNTGGGRSGIDSNSNLASIHTFDAAAGCDAVTFQPCSDKALASLKVYVDSFRPIYAINQGAAPNAAVATGRYPEDVYMGGNPWYLSTFGVAEQLYDALTVWGAQSFIEVTSISQTFFQQFYPSIGTGTYTKSSPQYGDLMDAIRGFADGFVAINANYTPSDGGLAEQFGKSNGTPLSAVDLTWSYASALTAFAARDGKNNATWGAKGLVVPSVCQSYAGPTITVTFNVQATTVLGENIYLVGSVNALQNWSPDSAILMSPANYPVWSVNVTLPANNVIQYKYIRKLNGDITWESDPNNQITTVGTGEQVVNDYWR